MSDTQEKKEKIRGFRVTPESNEIVAKLIKESGKEPGEWFEDLIKQVRVNELVLEKSNIPPDLRKHFGSDVAAIKEATNLIESMFINQMNRIAVEKNNWNQHLQSTIKEFEEKQIHFRKTIGSLEESIQLKDLELETVQGTVLQLQTKIEGFDKLEEQLRKNILQLESDRNKTEADLQQIKMESIQEREKHYHEMSDLRQVHKEEKDKLNQQIVDLVNQLKEVEPIKEENKALAERLKEAETTMRQHSAQYELRLTRFQEQAEVEKEKAILAVERELRDTLYNQNREDTKELYEKIAKLQEENQKLQIEIAQLKNQK